jgi:hypothetical protein
MAVGTVKNILNFFPLYCMDGCMQIGQTGQTVNTHSHGQTYETVAFCDQRREEMEEKGREGKGRACDTMWEQQETEQAARVLGHAAVL